MGGTPFLNWHNCLPFIQSKLIIYEDKPLGNMTYDPMVDFVQSELAYWLASHFVLY